MTLLWSHDVKQFSWIALLLILLAFVARAVIYLPIGSYLPAVVASIGLLIVGGAAFAGETAFRWTSRVVGVTVVLYGVARLLLGGVMAFAGVSSAHAMQHTGMIFMAISAAYIAAGLLVCMRPPSRWPF